MKKIQAFTLIEILITLMLFAILSGLTLTSFNTISHRVKNQLAQSQLVQAIHLAQDQARLRGVPVAFLSRKEGGYLVFLNEKRDGVLSDRNQIIAVFYERSKQSKLIFRSYPKYRKYLLFFPGLVQNDNSSFWYCSGSEFPDWVMTLSQLGRTRLKIPDETGQIKNSQGDVYRCDD